jgi:hypothetical protein
MSWWYTLTSSSNLRRLAAVALLLFIRVDPPHPVFITDSWNFCDQGVESTPKYGENKTIFPTIQK